MPQAVSSFAGKPVTAKALNTACYTVDGTPGKPNGIMWQALGRLFLEGHQHSTVNIASAPTNGTWTVLSSSTAGISEQIYDAGGYFNATQDGTLYQNGYYHFQPSISGGAGDGSTPGGWFIVCHQESITTTTTQQWTGAGIYVNGGWVCGGSRQRGVTTAGAAYSSVPFFLDLLDGTGNTIEPAVIVADSASATAGMNGSTTPSDLSGEAWRHFTVWAAVDSSNATNYGTPALPVPYDSYATGTTIGTTSAYNVNLDGNNGPGGVLNYLMNAPILRIGTKLSTSVPNGGTVGTVVPLGSIAGGDVDNYGGWNSSTNTYTVQRSGLYLVHGIVIYSANTAGTRLCGVNINNSLNFGPGYAATAAGTVMPTKTQIFSLYAGDTVQLVTWQNSGSAIALNNGDFCRLMMVWLGAQATNTPLSYTPPDTTFRWQSGTKASVLPAVMQQHLGDDLSFLMYRPYFMGYLAVSNVAYSDGGMNVAHADSVGGAVHNDNGDPYNTWAGIYGNSEYPPYVWPAPVSGWYLAVGEITLTAPTSTSNPLVQVAAAANSSGGRYSYNIGDVCQAMFAATDSGSDFGGNSAGGTFIMPYYLQAGEYIEPYFGTQNYSATYIYPSSLHYELIWISS